MANFWLFLPTDPHHSHSGLNGVAGRINRPASCLLACQTLSCLAVFGDTSRRWTANVTILFLHRGLFHG